MSGLPFPTEPFPGAFNQRCVKCESAAEAAIARRIEDGRWAVLVQCLNGECRYSREIDVDPKDLDKSEKWA